VYADLDFEALQNHETLLDGRHVVLAAMEDESAADQQAVPNAWMVHAAPPVLAVRGRAGHQGRQRARGEARPPARRRGPA